MESVIRDSSQSIVIRPMAAFPDEELADEEAAGGDDSF
jgi:hypothetical protein